MSAIRLICLLPILMVSALGMAAELDAERLGGTAGLIVALEPNPDEVGQLAALATSGSWLVQVLSTDPTVIADTRARFSTAAVHGLGTARLVTDWSRLPFRERLVDVIIADPSRLANGPDVTELDRVLVPRGRALLGTWGTWQTHTAPDRPEGMGDWTHFDCDEAGSMCSPDTVAGPPRQLQWVSTSVHTYAPRGNAARYPITMGWRIVGDLAVFQWRNVHYQWTARSNNARDHKGPGPVELLRARSAWNGLPRWEDRLTGSRHHYGGVHRWLVVADQERLYTFTDPGGPAKALDLRTGTPLITYSEGLRLQARDFSQPISGLRIHDGTLYQYSGNTVVALDATSGERHWRWTAGRKERLHGLIIAAEQGAAYVLVGPAAERATGGPRWPGLVATSVVCLELDDGSLRWQQAAVMGEPADDPDNFDAAIDDLLSDPTTESLGVDLVAEEDPSRPISQLLAYGDQVALVANDGWFASLAATDGTERWRLDVNKHRHLDPDRRPPFHIFGALVRDDGLYYSGAGSVKRLALADGSSTRLGIPNVNQACARTSATPNWVVFGWQTWVDRDWNWWLHASRRSGCAEGTVHANGMAYHTPTMCGCLSPLTGYAVYSGTPSVLDDSPPAVESTALPALPASAIVPLAEEPRGLIDAEWRIDHKHRGEYNLPDALEPVDAGAVQLVARRFAMRLEARTSAGDVAWAAALSAAPGGPPLVHEQLVYQATIDGFINAYDLAGGTQRWRLRVAPGSEQIIDGCRIASPWPARHVVLHRGQICVAAGRHPEIDGGIVVMGLEPTTGTTTWRHVLTKPIVQGYDNTGRRHPEIRPTAPRHGYLHVTESGLLALEGLEFDPAWTPAELEAAHAKYGHRSRYSQPERP